MRRITDIPRKTKAEKIKWMEEVIHNQKTYKAGQVARITQMQADLKRITADIVSNEALLVKVKKWKEK